MPLFRATITAQPSGVERDAEGVPTAFRIWNAGVNLMNHIGQAPKSHLFTENSARLLMAAQALRGNEYSIDVDHMSLSESAPIENHAAVGWHQLEVRDGDLWAVNVRWVPAVAAGLKSDPPSWRYFSPAYNAEPDTGEITAYLNTALTNNPATWSVTALATQATEKPKMDSVKAAVAAAMGDDEDKKKEARAYLKAAADKGDDESPKAKACLAAMFGDDDEPKKEEARASVTASAKPVLAVVETASVVEAKLSDIEKRVEVQERASLLSTRKDLNKAQLASLASVPVSHLASVLEAIPVAPVTTAAAAIQPEVKATVGVAHADAASSADAEVFAKMGLTTQKASIGWKGNSVVYPALTAKEAADYRASKGLDK